ncbi:replication initiation factor domain-containing protein [Escherichia coli]|uniref:replication initiation factor domain-containing protein n=1 Tax=Escherichia coli TaxID=562 RepID=UPI00128F94B0|nr:replication initiation factor domain-containing protein [Escherichia coli]MQL46345.1 hypothetical protein [Escherichia coli]
MSLYGYSGMTHKSIRDGVSYDGSRGMIAGTGSAAHDAATMLYSLNVQGLSIARIDVQETLVVDNPDRTIMFLSPRKAYAATRISTVHGEGETLYVGAPKSRARLRLYNKTAESGLSPEIGKYLRVEVQLRDRYADQAYGKWVDGKVADVLSYWIGKMLDEPSARDMLNLCKHLSVQSLGQIEQPDDEWASRRKLWFERSVVPAMAKLFLQEPDYLETAIRLLTGVNGNAGNGADEQVSD